MPIPDDLTDFATPTEVAEALRTTRSALSQMRYAKRGPKFIRSGNRILYRWNDVRSYLAEKNGL